MNSHNTWFDADWVERCLMMAITETHGSLTKRKIRKIIAVLKQHPNEDGSIIVKEGKYGWQKL